MNEVCGEAGISRGGADLQSMWRGEWCTLWSQDSLTVKMPGSKLSAELGRLSANKTSQCGRET